VPSGGLPARHGRGPPAAQNAGTLHPFSDPYLTAMELELEDSIILKEFLSAAAHLPMIQSLNSQEIGILGAMFADQQFPRVAIGHITEAALVDANIHNQDIQFWQEMDNAVHGR
jgi:hypothetical protein